VADVAREVVQDAQRDRTAVIAAERARSRAAEANEDDGGAEGPPAIPNDRQR
jgi:hypothetical protein